MPMTFAPQESQFVHDDDQPIFDELDNIYRSQQDPHGDMFFDADFRPDLLATPDIRGLYAIADELAEARNKRIETQFLNHE